MAANNNNKYISRDISDGYSHSAGAQVIIPKNYIATAVLHFLSESLAGKSESLAIYRVMWSRGEFLEMQISAYEAENVTVAFARLEKMQTGELSACKTESSRHKVVRN